MPTKKKPATKSTKSSKKAVGSDSYRSFKKSSEATPFLTFRLTYQTAYWLIFSIFILGVGIWMVVLNLRVQNVYDQAEATKVDDTSIHITR